MRDRNLLQVRDHDQPIPWKVQFNLGNSSRPSNQCRNSIQGKHLITDELGEAASLPVPLGETLGSDHSEGFVVGVFCLPLSSLLAASLSHVVSAFQTSLSFRSLL